ncbi:MAG: CcdB family protein [Caldimonas sp.]
MAQWDVYPNPSTRLRDEIPYLVDLQSNLLSGLGSRLVAPLARTRLAPAGLPRVLCPGFTIGATPVVLLPQECGPIDARLLKRRVVSLRSQAHEIVAAIDAVIGGV